jgi:hypothetical protein
MPGNAFAIAFVCLCLLPACSGPQLPPAARPADAALSAARPADAAPPAPVPPAPAGELPAPPTDELQTVLADLSAEDLQLLGAEYINPSVVRLELAHGGRRFRAKWKAMGQGGSEVQEGVDGNNSPRCEVAAFLLSRELLGPDEAGRLLVPPVVVRALHRDVPCDRSCRHLPRLVSAASPPTFPEINDHLVLGALSLWIEGARMPKRLHGELWNPERYAKNPAYRRSVSDLFLFLYVIAHGDANYGPNFLLRASDLGRVYSIDNGRAFDGIPYYVGEGDPDWQPLATLAPGKLVAPRFSAQTVAALAGLTVPRLRQQLALVAAVELGTGRTVREPSRDAALRSLVGQPLARVPGLTRRSRQTYTGAVPAGGPTFVLLGIGPDGVEQAAARAAQVSAYLRRAGPPLFGD